MWTLPIPLGGGLCSLSLGSNQNYLLDEDRIQNQGLSSRWYSTSERILGLDILLLLLQTTGDCRVEGPKEDWFPDHTGNWRMLRVISRSFPCVKGMWISSGSPPPPPPPSVDH